MSGGDVVHNEFSTVGVAIDRSALGPRLRLEDRRSGRYRYLDPLELEGLVWAADAQLAWLVDPAWRWADPEQEE